MSKHTAITRYLLILKKLQRGPAPFADIHFSLQTEGEIRGAVLATDLRTFQRDLREIESLFGVRIAYHRGLKSYAIAEHADDRQQALRLLESYELLDALHAADGYAGQVFFEARKPGGLEHFGPLLRAIRERRAVVVTYQKFGGDPQDRTLHPLALKEAQSRWYLVAEDPADGIVKTFGLDRMIATTHSGRGFEPTAGVDVARMFDNFFGVLTPPDAPVEEVLLQFTAFQGQYVKTYPLHHSQRVLEEGPDRVVVRLSLCITLDLVMELLSFGTSLTALAPLSLVEQLAAIHRQAWQNHSPAREETEGGRATPQPLPRRPTRSRQPRQRRAASPHHPQTGPATPEA